MPTISLKLVKKGDKLVPFDLKEKEKLDYVKSSTKEGKLVNIICDFGDEPGERVQVQKIYAMLGVIQKETMNTMDSLKNEVKEQSGFFTVNNGIKEYKSFSNPENHNKIDLDRVIDTIYEIGDFLNINLKKQF